MKHELLPTSTTPLQSITDADIIAAQVKLWEFLGCQIRSYTMGDSSSIRIETAKQLFRSMYYIMGIDLTHSSALDSILDWDLDNRFSNGIKAIEDKIQTAKQLWETVFLSIPKMENISLSTTLHSIKTFPRRYHYRYFAHEIPCDIDYQLCHPGPENLLGVDYILEYLRRLFIENDFLRRFDPTKCIGALEAYCCDYKGLLINLYEPIATNAIGLALIGSDILKLNISPAERKCIVTKLKILTKKQAMSAFQFAAASVCSTLEIHQSIAQRYLFKLAKELYPRIGAALSSENLDHVFLTFKERKSVET